MASQNGKREFGVESIIVRTRRYRLSLPISPHTSPPPPRRDATSHHTINKYDSYLTNPIYRYSGSDLRALDAPTKFLIIFCSI